MIWLVTRPLVWSLKLVFGTTKMTTKATSGSFKLGYRAGRVVGFRRMTMLAIGVGVGLLVAPRTGAQNREALRRWFDDLIGNSSFDTALLETRSLEFDRDEIHSN